MIDLPPRIVAIALCVGAAAESAPAQVLDDWRLTGPGRDHYSLVHDSTVASQGQYSLLLRTAENLADSVWAAAEGVINIRPLRGGNIRVSASLRTEGAGKAALWARVDGEEDGRYVNWGSDTMRDRELVGDTPWRSYELVLPAPEGARMLVLGTRLRGSGSVWVDQIQLDAVDETVELTGESEKRATEFPYREPPHLQDPVRLVTFEPEIALTVAEVIAASAAEEWEALDPENTVYFELPDGRFVLQLASTFAPQHVANIKDLVRAGYFDGGAVVRSQENYVAQWSIRSLDEGESLAEGIHPSLPAEFEVSDADALFVPVPDGDVYAPTAGFVNGFPVGRDSTAGTMWMAHCYGIVGVGRGNDPDSGNGSSLYAVNGHSPRHLDRNLTMVGRVVSGMEHLSTRPRGTGRLGFYETPEERAVFTSARMGTDIPPGERANIETLRTDSPSFKKLMMAARSRTEDFFLYPTDRIDLCNVRRPTREKTD